MDATGIARRIRRATAFAKMFVSLFGSSLDVSGDSLFPRLQPVSQSRALHFSSRPSAWPACSRAAPAARSSTMSGSPLQMSGQPGKSAASATMPTSTHHMKCANRATALKDLQYRQKVHLIKLENMKCTIDMTPPVQYPHVQVRAHMLPRPAACHGRLRSVEGRRARAQLQSSYKCASGPHA